MLPRHFARTQSLLALMLLAVASPAAAGVLFESELEVYRASPTRGSTVLVSVEGDDLRMDAGSVSKLKVDAEMLRPSCGYEGRADGYFARESLCSSAEDRWYSKHLSAMEEPSLWLRSEDPTFEGYRFLWLRSFHAPVAVRVELAPSVPPTVTTTILDGKGGYEPGAIASSKSRAMDEAERRDLERQLERHRLWEVPNARQREVDRWAQSEAGEPMVMCLDGAMWILEAVREGRYHLILNHCGGDNTAVLELGRFFLELTREEFDPIY